MSNIEWTEKTLNITIGCTEVSPGCTNCYAARMAHRLAHIPSQKANYQGLTKKLPNGKIVWTGTVLLMPDRLNEIVANKKPTVYFIDSMSDLFHADVPVGFIHHAFAHFAKCPQHTFQILTKRADRMAQFFKGKQPIPNVWLGVSVENQKSADERIPHLLQTLAAVRWLSCEPLLGPVKLETKWFYPIRKDFENPDVAVMGVHDAFNFNQLEPMPGIDWVVVGGESGPDSRPMHPDWARGLRNQCAAANVPFFFKQWGNWAAIDMPWLAESIHPCLQNEQWLDFTGGQDFNGLKVWRMRNVGKKSAGRLLDGVLHNQYPLYR